MRHQNILSGVALSLALAFGAAVGGAAASTSLDDGVMVVSGGTTVNWLQGDESHEFFQSLGAVETPAGFTAATVYLTGPADSGESPLPGSVSDAFTITSSASNPGHLDIFFISAGASSSEIANFLFLSPPSALNTLAETGSFQDVSSYFGQQSGFAKVMSDVPEPTTWAMMLIGVGGIGGLLRRNVRKSGVAVATA
jgi:hypothetical protein